MNKQVNGRIKNNNNQAAKLHNLSEFDSPNLSHSLSSPWPLVNTLRNKERKQYLHSLSEYLILRYLQNKNKKDPLHINSLGLCLWEVPHQK